MQSLTEWYIPKMTIFLIGLGNMGTAVARVLTSAKSEYDTYAADKNSSNLERLAIEYGIQSDRSYSNLNKADLVILAVKPQDLVTVAAEIKGKIPEQSILVSIVAGATIKKIVELFAHEKVVRAMPNMALMVGEGITAWKSSSLSEEETQKVKKFFDDLSENFEVADEDLIDAVTAVSGSGPAYFLLLAQVLERSARELGLAENEARILVEKTLSGAAKLQSGKSYEELINSVASKGGTTETALRVLEKGGFGKLIDGAVKAAHKRSKELRQ